MKTLTVALYAALSLGGVAHAEKVYNLGARNRSTENHRVKQFVRELAQSRRVPDMTIELHNLSAQNRLKVVRALWTQPEAAVSRMGTARIAQMQRVSVSHAQAPTLVGESGKRKVTLQARTNGLAVVGGLWEEQDGKRVGKIAVQPLVSGKFRERLGAAGALRFLDP